MCIILFYFVVNITIKYKVEKKAKWMIKKIMNMFKPQTFVLKDTKTWEDIGQWNDFNNIGRIMYKQKTKK